MKTLDQYITKGFLAHFLISLAGFAGILELFDLLKSADDLIELHGNSMGVLMKYSLLRLPAVITFIAPFATLTGTFLFLVRITHSNEILAMRAAGVRTRSLVSSLFIATSMVVICQFIITDQIAARTNRALDLWLASAADDEESDLVAANTGDPLWLADGPWVVRSNFIANHGKDLMGVRLLKRDSDGLVAEKIKARNAYYRDRVWMLTDVVHITMTEAGEAEGNRSAQELWQTDLRPIDFRELSEPPNRLSFAGIISVIRSPGEGIISPTAYKVWAHKRVAGPLSNFIMVLIAMPAVFLIARSGGLFPLAGYSIGLGFLFFILDGVTLNLGLSATIPPILSVWAPLAGFACIGVYRLLLHYEL